MGRFTSPRWSHLTSPLRDQSEILYRQYFEEILTTERVVEHIQGLPFFGTENPELRRHFDVDSCSCNEEGEMILVTVQFGNELPSRLYGEQYEDEWVEEKCSYHNLKPVQLYRLIVMYHQRHLKLYLMNPDQTAREEQTWLLQEALMTEKRSSKETGSKEAGSDAREAERWAQMQKSLIRIQHLVSELSQELALLVGEPEPEISDEEYLDQALEQIRQRQGSGDLINEGVVAVETYEEPRETFSGPCSYII